MIHTLNSTSTPPPSSLFPPQLLTHPSKFAKIGSSHSVVSPHFQSSQKVSISFQNSANELQSNCHVTKHFVLQFYAAHLSQLLLSGFFASSIAGLTLFMLIYVQFPHSYQKSDTTRQMLHNKDCLSLFSKGYHIKLGNIYYHST